MQGASRIKLRQNSNSQPCEQHRPQERPLQKPALPWKKKKINCIHMNCQESAKHHKYLRDNKANKSKRSHQFTKADTQEWVPDSHTGSSSCNLTITSSYLHPLLATASLRLLELLSLAKQSSPDGVLRETARIAAHNLGAKIATTLNTNLSW